MFVSDTVKYVGVNDNDIDLFEGQYVVKNGMAYNSYVVFGESAVAVFDTVDAKFKNEWLANVKTALGGKTPDYLVSLHTEPDHSANIYEFKKVYPNVKIVASAKAFVFIKQFFGTDFEDGRVVVGEGDKLDLGGRTLTFYTAPMVHWPEVIVAYDDKDKILFSADAFGKFGAIGTDEDWACEARRYYFGIVGKYGVQAKALLNKAALLDIKTICPLHGPVLSDNLGYYLGLYNTWASYGVESEGVMIAYTSVYGHTAAAAKLLADELAAKGAPKVVLADLAREDLAECVEDAFRYGKLVLATTTYNGDIFPFMKHFIDALVERNYQNRKIAFIENGTWAPIAAKIMKKAFENSKNVEFCETTVTLKSALNGESVSAVKALADELLR